MGYSTDFKGSLQFTRDLVGSELSILNGIFNEDVRDHDDWPNPDGDLYYVAIELTDGMDGIKWDGTEKTYRMESLVNMLIEVAGRDIPDFGLTGEMLAFGEDLDDRWILRMIDGVATKIEIKPTGTPVECPECSHMFRID
ncbi:MAG: hypothetical protein JKY50_12920 [Oleispira sp.]|nr:hypothetical protein [Oleispira sp.]